MKPTPDCIDWLADEALEILIEEKELMDTDEYLSVEILIALGKRDPLNFCATTL